MKILMIVGSTRKNSFNMQLAKKAAELISDTAEVSFLDYASIPFMNQDIEFPAPEEIAKIRAEVKAADGLWFFTPEYNHSYPGMLKNLVDWLSRPVEPGNYATGRVIAGKKAALSGAAGKSKAGFAREKLRELLSFISVKVLEEEAGVELTPESFQTDKLNMREEELAQLKLEAEAFMKFLQE